MSKSVSSTAWVLDPTDPTVAFLGSGTDADWGMAVGPITLHNVHLADKCAGTSCMIHNPSEHHMRAWPIHWRSDRAMAERICPHGVGHPDPDSAAWHNAMGHEGYGVHGCDGCCRG